MRKSKLKYPIGVLLAAALLAGCQSDETSETTVPAETVSEAAAPVSAPVAEVAAVDERTAEEFVANMQANITKAEATNGPGSPALWTLKDEDTTVHLFGTVHLLRPETEWRSDAINAAFASADTLVTEADTDSPEALQKAGALVGQLAVFTDGTKLNDVIDDEDEPIIDASLKELDMSLAAMQQVKPWFVGFQMGIAQIIKSGYDPQSGVEIVLLAEAREAGKSLKHFETIEDQFKILAGGEIEEQVEGLVFASQTSELGPKMLDSLVDEWADGDVVGLGEIVADPDAIGGQEAYDALLVERNKNWIPQIKELLNEPGTVFVAVGAGHLAGPDSVITMLRTEGLEVSGPQ